MKRKLSLLLAMVLAMTMVMGIGVTSFAAVSGDGTNSSPYLVETFSEGDQVPFEDDIYLKCSDAFSNPGGVYYYLVYNEDKTSWIVNGAFSSMSNTKLKPNDSTFGGLYDKLAYWRTESGNQYYFYCISKQSPVPEPTSEDSSTHVHNFQWQTITEPTQYADGLEGEVCSCGAVRNTQKLSAYAYSLNDYATPLINAAKAGQTITFEFGEWNSFPRSFMEKLVNKSANGVTFVFHYKWNHVKQEITIPAGTPIDLNFDWYGPAKMAELYGAN